MNTVTLYRDKAAEWRWRTKAANGQVIADSGEGYKNRTDCLEMAQRVNGEDALIVEESSADE